MLAWAIGLAGTGFAAAEVSEVKIVAKNGSNYLPLFVMQGQSWSRSIWPRRVWARLR